MIDEVFEYHHHAVGQIVPAMSGGFVISTAAGNLFITPTEAGQIIPAVSAVLSDRWDALESEL